MGLIDNKKIICQTIEFIPSVKTIKSEAGASINHNYIVSHLIAIIKSHFDRLCCLNINENLKINKVCESCINVFPSDLYIPNGETYCLPDIVLVKGTFILNKHGKQSRDCISNPKIIIEVYSESNKEGDILDKLEEFKNLNSFDTLFIVNSIEEDSITEYSRSNEWKEKYTDEIIIESLKIPRATIYDKFNKL